MSLQDDFRAYIYRILDIFPSYLSAPARWVADRLFAVWDEITGFLIRTKAPFQWVVERAYRYVNAFWRFVNECATTVRWLVTLFVPRWARWALNLAIDTVRAELNSARTFLQSLINDARSFAQRLVNTLDAWARGQVKSLLDKLNDTINTLRAVRDTVVKYLTHPSVLVDWIFSALWSRFWRFANDHAEAIAAAYWPRKDKLLVATLTRIETFLMRVL